MRSSAISLNLFAPSKTPLSFADFTALTPISYADDVQDENRFTAQLESTPPNICYDDLWFVLRRNGQFLAQVEKAAAELFQLCLGYGTQIHLVEEDNGHYIASRKIKAYTDWNNIQSTLSLDENNNLVCANKPVKNLAKVAAITEFFADTDCYGSNFGLQELSDHYRVFKIDNEHMFSFDHQGEEGAVSIEHEVKLSEHLAPCLESDEYKREKQEMLTEIANIDFSVIENIIRNTVTADQMAESLAATRALLDSGYFDNQPPVDPLDEEDSCPIPTREEVEKQLLEMVNADPETFGVNLIINTLRKRHQQLRSQMEVGAKSAVHAFNL